MYIRTAVAAGLLAAGLVLPARADLTVKYRTTHSELVLFKQPQDAPFAKVSYTLYLSGAKVRTEMVDALGHAWWFIADRHTGLAYGLDPVTKKYWREARAWGCDSLTDEVAVAARRLMQQAGVQALEVEEADGTTVGGISTRAAALRFTGRVLGSPQPVATEIDLYFPRSDTVAFGRGGVQAVFCGEKPSPSQWATALTRHLGLDRAAAAFLGGVITVPMRITVDANLGVGNAALTLDAVETSSAAVDGAMFTIPNGFTERK